MDHDITNRYKPDYTLEQFSQRVREAILARLKGTTLTQEDAEIIIREVKMCTALMKETE